MLQSGIPDSRRSARAQQNPRKKAVVAHVWSLPDWSNTMSKNTNGTSGGMASKAGSILGNPNASATARSLAGSALAQAGTAKQTGARMEDRASQVLSSSNYSATTRSLARSVLSQSNK